MLLLMAVFLHLFPPLHIIICCAEARHFLEDAFCRRKCSHFTQLYVGRLTNRFIFWLSHSHTHTLSQTALTWCSLSFSWFISLLLFFLQLSEATNKTHHEIWVALCAPMDALFLFSMFGRHHRRRRRQRLHLPFSCRVQIFLLTTHTQLIIYSQTLKKPAILYNTSINLHITLDNLCRFYHCN